jgi:hypothetical protein
MQNSTMPACSTCYKKAIGFTALLCACMFAKAQSYTGYAGAPYSGVYAIANNPASILNHRVKGDINLAGVSAGIGNNIVRFKYSKRNNEDGGFSFKEPITRSGKLFFNTDVFGPGILIRLSDKHAFALTTRARAFANVYGIDPAILNSTLPDTIRSEFINRSLDLKDLTTAAHAWKEVALTYSREVAHNTYGVWKAGLSIKYAGGIGAALLHTKNLGYVLDTFFDPGAGRRQGIVNNLNGSIAFGYTKNIDSLVDKDLTGFTNSSIGFDVGLTYEYRDEMQAYETKYSDKTANYIWKIGAALTDIGFIRYPMQQTKWVKAAFNNRSYLLDDLAPPSDSSDIEQMYNYYKTLFNVSTQPSALTMQLPTTLRLSYDRYFNKWLGVTALVNIPVMFSKISNYNGNYNPVSVSVTARAEAPWGGFYFPVSYSSVGGTQVGAALRLGPLVVGSASIFKTRFFKTKAADAYVILRIPLFGYREYINAIFKPYKPALTKKQRRMLNCPSN